MTDTKASHDETDQPSGTGETAPRHGGLPRTEDLHPGSGAGAQSASGSAKSGRAAGDGVVKSSPPPSARRRGPSLADLLIGTVVAERYELKRKLGEGAMGWVFLAEHTEIGKKFAVKVLRPSLCRLPEAVRRFRREARAATQIGSKHIVDVTDFGTTPNGAVFFVMEHLEGGEDLGTSLKKSGKMSWQRVVHILLQMCEALQAAHDSEIIHRDVKPANIYRVEREGDQDFIKVLDFGIARLANPKDSIVTQTGVVMGTPDFMAPEQAQGRHVDQRADVYSLAASAYALLTGRPPFTGANEYDVIYKQLNEDPRPPSEVAPRAEIPAWLDDVLLHAMRKNPDERFQTMAEFAEAIQAGVAGKHVAVAEPTGVGEVAAPQPAALARDKAPISPALLVLAALALAVMGGLAAYFLVASF